MASKIASSTTILGEPEAISSKLNDPSALRNHILGLIVSNTVLSSQAIQNFLQHTFHYFMLLNYGLPDSNQQQLSQSQRKHPKSMTKTIFRRHENRTQMQRKGGRGGDPLGQFDDIESIFTTATESWVAQACFPIFVRAS